METITVENLQNEVVLDDAALNPVQPEAEPVSQLTEITQDADATPPAKEPGWIRGRIDKAVAKAIKETEDRMSAQFEATLAPIRESMMDRQAEQLVASGEFKSKEIALEYVRMKGGNVSTAPTAQPAETQTRDAQGRFAPKPQQQEGDAVAKAKASLLAAQADKIKASKGLDVMAVFQSNPDVQQRILSGEWDFYDVADALQNRQGMPSPMRSANGAGLSPTSIADMTDAQFAQLQRNLAAGKVYALN